MNNILVTGGAGFIPSCLVEGLLKEQNKVISIDNFETGKEGNIIQNENHTFVKADVNDYEQIAPIILENKIDYIFHYAALVGVKRTLKNPIQVLEDINGFNNIFSLARETKVKKIFFSSSSEVYGEPVHLPQEEYSTPLNSRLPYAVVKNVGECFCKSYQQEFGLDFTIFRFFNTYGPKQSDDFVVSKFIASAMKNEDLTVYGDGSQTRTLCFIDDHIDATMNAFSKNLFNNEIVNIGNDNEISMLELAKTIISLTESKSDIVHLPPLKEGDMTRRQPEITRMKELLGRDLITLEQGLLSIINSRQ
jgi:UDP-glucose 4-epimerase